MQRCRHAPAFWVGGWVEIEAAYDLSPGINSLIFSETLRRKLALPAQTRGSMPAGLRITYWEGQRGFLISIPTRTSLGKEFLVLRRIKTSSTQVSKDIKSANWYCFIPLPYLVNKTIFQTSNEFSTLWWITQIRYWQRTQLNLYLFCWRKIVKLKLFLSLSLAWQIDFKRRLGEPRALFLPLIPYRLFLSDSATWYLFRSPLQART